MPDSKIIFNYERLVADMETKRQTDGIGVRQLGEMWGIRPATVVEWGTRHRRPSLDHILDVVAWLGRDVGAYVERVE